MSRAQGGVCVWGLERSLRSPRPERWWVSGWPDSQRDPLMDGGGLVVAPHTGQRLASCSSEGLQDT